jgi:hypothetical protein
VEEGDLGELVDRVIMAKQKDGERKKVDLEEEERKRQMEKEGIMRKAMEGKQAKTVSPLFFLQASLGQSLTSSSRLPDF